MASDNKDMMAKHASWSEGILGDKAAPSAVAYSWIDRNVPVSGRTHMLLADLTASVHARSPGLSVQQAVLAAAKDMVQKGVATGDLRTFVEQGGRFSRPGAKDMMATRNPKAREKWETVFYEYFDGVPVSIMDSAKIKNDINAILASGADLKVEMPKLVKKYGRFSRPGAKAKFKVEDRFYFGKGRKERFAEIDVVNQLMQLAMKEGMADRMRPEIDRVLGSGSFDKLFKSYKSALISKRIMELKRQGKSTPEAFDLVLGAGAYKNMVGELYDALRAKAGAKHSRPGKPERFADDAKQIADTILKQLGGGRFIAMTGAKNLAFMSNPPGLHMSIGRGTKDGIKYLRVNYDRGSDTYTMIFANKSGGTVKSVSNVYANSLQRVFTSTTGFDTHL